MARATRSTTTHDIADKLPDHPPQTPRKGAAKKRKRNSDAENEDTLPAKQSRTEDKLEGSPNPGEEHSDNDKTTELPSSGLVPVLTADAANILDVLEMVDTQGLLDRVFPLPVNHDDTTTSATASSSSSTSSMLSLRTLLKNSSQYPLKLLYTAVKHLYPISSHPRFRPSETASQQLRFCSLAFSLLDQASRNVAPVPLDSVSVFTDGDIAEDAASPTSSHTPSGVKPRKFALVQHLPTGDWWTSVSSGMPTADGTNKDPKSLYTAKAELVSIFPTASSAQLARRGTLGDYGVKRAPDAVPTKPPPPQRVSCGKFLDYGPYASFAPSFDQDGVEVGRVGMGEVIFNQEMKRRFRAAVKGKRKAYLAAQAVSTDGIVEEASSSNPEPTASGPSSVTVDLGKELETLLPSDEVEAIKASLGSLEMEQAVDELLQKNAKALARLEELQRRRLRAQGGGSSIVEVDSEEWDVAQGITDSLALLASLRPRVSGGDPEQAPLIPPASVLHKLQRTLPLDATEGWFGTLPEGRTTAFRDDTTLQVRASALAASKAAAPPATPAPKATTPAPAYTPYPYSSGYQATPYRAGYAAYAQGQTGYYSSTGYVPATPQAQTQYATTAQQQQQQYYQWYQNSGRSTPQPLPAVAAAATTGATVNGYYGAQTSTPLPQLQPQPQRAVANTVLSSAKQAAAVAAYPYVAPTLPPHMRTAAGVGVGSVSAPGTPPPATPASAVAGSYGGYYGGYVTPSR